MDIDALAGPFAIEHTSVDTLPEQRRDSDWFMKAAGDLDGELGVELSCRLEITLEYDAIGRGQDWSDIRAGLKRWILDVARDLPDEVHRVGDVPNVPFRLHVRRSSDWTAGVSFARYEPEDDTLGERVGKAVRRKAKKLARYQPKHTAILLIENDDIALMNQGKMQSALSKAFSQGFPTSIDQLWYADTSIPSHVEFSDFTGLVGTHPSGRPSPPHPSQSAPESDDP